MLQVDLGGIGRGGQWLTINADSSGTRATPDVVADIRECAHELESYLDPQSVGAMRCIHTLEHIDVLDIMPTIKYWRTFLKSGGTLLIVVPHLGSIINDYAYGTVPYEVVAALAHGDTPSYRRTTSHLETHKWSWDEDSLRRDLAEAGYKDIQLAGDEHWPATWTFDYPAFQYTGLVGKWQVANLRMIGVAP